MSESFFSPLPYPSLAALHNISEISGPSHGTKGQGAQGRVSRASLHLASVPHLPIKIKKLIFFCLPLRTRLFL